MIKRLKRGDTRGANTYAGNWRRKTEGQEGYVGSRAKASTDRPGSFAPFNRMAARNICDYFGYLNVAATLECTITKVKELRLYTLTHRDSTLVTKLRFLNVEYLRNKYGIDMPPFWPHIEFDQDGYSWMKDDILAVMYSHLDLGCFQGLDRYRDRDYRSPEEYLSACSLSRDPGQLTEIKKKGLMKIIKRQESHQNFESEDWE